MCGARGRSTLCLPCKDSLWEQATAAVAEEKAAAAKKAKEKTERAELMARDRRRYFIDIVKEAINELEREKKTLLELEQPKEEGPQANHKGET